MDFLLNWVGTLPGAAAQGLIWGVMAIGLYITFKILDVADLTVDGSICTGAAVCTILITKGVNVWIAMLCALVAGMLTGLVTGLLHTLLGIPVILSGILTQLMLWSVNLAICAVIIAVLYWFFGAKFGMSLRTTGINLEMSRAQGINTEFTKVFGLALSNGIVAFAGSLLAQQQAAANINMGRGAIVIGLAAIIVGEAICSKSTANFSIRLLFVVCGSIIYWFVYQTVIFLGLPSELLKMLSALVVALFLGIPYIKKNLLSKKKKTGVKKNA